jgi:hypothetical protein
MAKAKIKLEKKDNLFVIDKNKNYESFFSMSIVFYQKLIQLMEEYEGVNIHLNPKFEMLLNKLSLNNEEIKLEQNDLKLLVDWTDCLCVIMLELDSIDFKDKEIQKYLRLSETLIQQGKEFLLIQ